MTRQVVRKQFWQFNYNLPYWLMQMKLILHVSGSIVKLKHLRSLWGIVPKKADSDKHPAD